MLLFICKPVATYSQQAYSLTLDELFRLGTENSLRLQASYMQEVIAGDKEKTAQTSRLPNVSIGATTGYIGQSTIFQRGLSGAVHPDLPDWSHNYNVEVTQPVYRGGKIRYTIKRAELEKQIAALNSVNNQAEIKLLLLRYYMDLFSLYKQKEVFAWNVEESTRRLDDVRRLKKRRRRYP
ncbi:MAG: TolC family protein [Parabacteroides sp.]|nr:TolC family protein [Parabacteroides sp.]